MNKLDALANLEVESKLDTELEVLDDEVLDDEGLDDTLNGEGLDTILQDEAQDTILQDEAGVVYSEEIKLIEVEQAIVLLPQRINDCVLQGDLIQAGLLSQEFTNYLVEMPKLRATIAKQKARFSLVEVIQGWGKANGIKFSKLYYEIAGRIETPQGEPVVKTLTPTILFDEEISSLKVRTTRKPSESNGEGKGSRKLYTDGATTLTANELLHQEFASLPRVIQDNVIKADDTTKVANSKGVEVERGAAFRTWGRFVDTAKAQGSLATWNEVVA